eukprot:gene14143-biopygen6590
MLERGWGKLEELRKSLEQAWKRLGRVWRPSIRDDPAAGSAAPHRRADPQRSAAQRRSAASTAGALRLRCGAAQPQRSRSAAAVLPQRSRTAVQPHRSRSAATVLPQCSCRGSHQRGFR